MRVPLRLGPLGDGGLRLRRSAIAWLRPDGHPCRAGEVVGYCNLSVEPTGARGLAGGAPFSGERALQAALAPAVAGRLRIAADAASGGLLNLLGNRDWDPEEIVGELEPEDGAAVEAETDGARLRVLMLAGRRMTWAVDVDCGLLPGWHSRARGWWGEGGDDAPTLLSAGYCDASGVVRGDSGGFAEMFEAAAFPAQMVHVSEHPLTPCAPILAEQLLRTPAEMRAISADMAEGLGRASGVASPADWIFAGALATQLGHSPIRERYETIDATGIALRRPADRILLSLGAEPRALLRHKTLGYGLHILAHDLKAAGPAIRAWLAASFERVPRTPEAVRDDLVRLFDAVGRQTGARFLVLNRMSTSAREDIGDYRPFDVPMGEVLTSIAAKEANLMLHDLARRDDVAIIDVDAIAAEIGGAAHVPDGVHFSGLMQAQVRAEVLHHLQPA